LANAEQLGGKEMSFNNFVDADAAWQLVSDFAERACAIIKHTNPAGAALRPGQRRRHTDGRWQPILLLRSAGLWLLTATG